MFTTGHNGDPLERFRLCGGAPRTGMVSSTSTVAGAAGGEQGMCAPAAEMCGGVAYRVGKGRVYAKGKHVGDTSMAQLSVGFQLGGQAYSEIIFFEDERSFKEFTSGNFEFGADASAVAITAGASAKAGSTGASAGASATQHAATTAGGYHKGMATFTVAKGGLMYEAAIGGQKFKYMPR